MHKSFIAIFSVLLSLFIFTHASAVTTYKWVDTDGSMVYSQHPPAEGVAFEKIKTRSPSRSNNTDNSGETSSARNSILEDKAKKDKDDILSKEMAKNEETRKKNCELAKKALQFYQVQRRWKDEEGNVKSLTDDERKVKIEESKENVKEFCE
ncbi:MAG: DUF4124 domain-containing protein [Gammaproteobacteria bacterium]|nr:DUF4124 domain-containing protein [Gammaproteobacteria bacterium]